VGKSPKRSKFPERSSDSVIDFHWSSLGTRGGKVGSVLEDDELDQGVGVLPLQGGHPWAVFDVVEVIDDEAERGALQDGGAGHQSDEVVHGVEVLHADERRHPELQFFHPRINFMKFLINYLVKSVVRNAEKLLMKRRKLKNFAIFFSKKLLPILFHKIESG
jgi:hypothetical protein